MLEGVLYFALGFLASGLLALMVAPAIWRRAVVLTRRRLEGSVPLTLNEIQADKDQLRAEFAMSTRRLEMSVEKLREKAAEQLIDINRKREVLTELSDETKQKSENLSELESQAGELRQLLQKRGEELDVATGQLRSAEHLLEERSGQIELVERKLRTVSSESDGRRIELAARDTQLQNLTDKVTDLSKLRNEHNSVSGKFESEIKSLKRELTSEKHRFEDMDKKLGQTLATLSDREEKLERRERELAKSRDRDGHSNTLLSASEEELAQVQAEKLSIEVQLAQTNLRMEALLDDASNDNVEKALSHIKLENRSLEEKLNEIGIERDAIKVELGALQLANGKNWDTERQENAVLRERMNDLAAQVTAMTAMLEGDDSMITAILARDKGGKPRLVKKSAQSSIGGNVTSLAERIRALQLASSET